MKNKEKVSVHIFLDKELKNICKKENINISKELHESLSNKIYNKENNIHNSLNTCFLCSKLKRKKDLTCINIKYKPKNILYVVCFDCFMEIKEIQEENDKKNKINVLDLELENKTDTENISLEELHKFDTDEKEIIINAILLTNIRIKKGDYKDCLYNPYTYTSEVISNFIISLNSIGFEFEKSKVIFPKEEFLYELIKNTR